MNQNPIARNGLSQRRRKKARVSAASLEQPPTAARAWVVAPELLVQVLVAVDDPAAPLDVGFAKGSLAAAWTWFQKEFSSSLKSGRMTHPPLEEIESGSSTGRGA